MKKIILLIAILFLVSGCSIEYNIEIIDENIIEDIDVFTSDMANLDIPQENYYSRSYRNIFDDMFNSNAMAYFNDPNFQLYYEGIQPNVSYYDKSLINESNRYGVNFSYRFTFNDYYRSSAIKSCFEDFTMIKNEDMYSLKTNNKCKLFDAYTLLDSVSINIVTDYDIIYNNADVVNGNTYTWNITRDNYTNKSISMWFDTIPDDLSNFDSNNVPSEDDPNSNIEEEETTQEEESNTLSSKQTNLIIIGAISIFVIIFVVVIVVKKKRL